MAYTTEERGKFLLHVPIDVKSEVAKWALERGITQTAMLNIIIMHGMDVQRLLDSQREAATAIVAGVQRD